MKIAAIVIAIGVLCTGCKVEPPKPPLVETVAILPFDSESNDVNAPDIMQRLVYLAMKSSAYRVLDIDETNAKLAKAGIQDGGQLPAVDPVKLGKDLGVQALLYGNVENFGYVNIGFYQEQKVTLELAMVNVTDGQNLWQNSGTGATRNLTLDKKEAQNRLTAGLAKQLVDKLFDSPLEEEACQATTKALATLPGFRFAGFSADEKARAGFKRGAKNAIKGAIK